MVFGSLEDWTHVMANERARNKRSLVRTKTPDGCVGGMAAMASWGEGKKEKEGRAEDGGRGGGGKRVKVDCSFVKGDSGRSWASCQRPWFAVYVAQGESDEA